MNDKLPKARRIYNIRFNKVEDYKLIKELHQAHKWDIAFMCKQLEISRAAYYKWLNATPTVKQLKDQYIVSKIKEIVQSNNSLFGANNMCYSLNNEYGIKCGHNRVYRLMCINDISSSYRRVSSYEYNYSKPEETAENILNRDFNADRPNEKWCTDVTMIKVPKTGEKLYISPIIDLYDRYPISISISTRNDTALTNESLFNAHKAYPNATPIFHSDRGFQYTRKVFKNQLESYGMTQSMSRVSRCIDNGVCEQFQGLFKDVLFVLYPSITSKQEMIEAIYGTLDYYINKYPQKRFKGKTCGQVRKEAMETSEPIIYPIKQANRYIKFWQDIKLKKTKVRQQLRI